MKILSRTHFTKQPQGSFIYFDAPDVNRETDSQIQSYLEKLQASTGESLDDLREGIGQNMFQVDTADEGDAGKLRLRNKPGSDGGVLHKLEKGEVVQFTGKTDVTRDGSGQNGVTDHVWFEVRTADGHEGWASSEYLSAVDVPHEPAPAPVAQKGEPTSIEDFFEELDESSTILEEAPSAVPPTPPRETKEPVRAEKPKERPVQKPNKEPEKPREQKGIGALISSLNELQSISSNPQIKDLVSALQAMDEPFPEGGGDEDVKEHCRKMLQVCSLSEGLTKEVSQDLQLIKMEIEKVLQGKKSVYEFVSFSGYSGDPKACIESYKKVIVEGIEAINIPKLVEKEGREQKRVSIDFPNEKEEVIELRPEEKNEQQRATFLKKLKNFRYTWESGESRIGNMHIIAEKLNETLGFCYFDSGYPEKLSRSGIEGKYGEIFYPVEGKPLGGSSNGEKPLNLDVCTRSMQFFLAGPSLRTFGFSEEAIEERGEEVSPETLEAEGGRTVTEGFRRWTSKETADGSRTVLLNRFSNYGFERSIYQSRYMAKSTIKIETQKKGETLVVNYHEYIAYKNKNGKFVLAELDSSRVQLIIEGEEVTIRKVGRDDLIEEKTYDFSRKPGAERPRTILYSGQEDFFKISGIPELERFFQ